MYIILLIALAVLPTWLLWIYSPPNQTRPNLPDLLSWPKHPPELSTHLPYPPTHLPYLITQITDNADNTDNVDNFYNTDILDN